jgi:alpha-tubulin suppressor-like RCC1 family protein
MTIARALSSVRVGQMGPRGGRAATTLKRVRTIGLCLVALSAMGAMVAAAPASATSPGAAAWGYAAFGQLGDGTFTGQDTCYAGNPYAPHQCSMTPVQVSELSGVSAISAGGAHSLALLSNGTVMAWGANEFGQLGDGTETPSDVPVAVLSGVTAISTGTYHSLALLSNGTVMAWGRNGFGQLGNGTTTTSSNVPVEVSGLSGVVAISGGGEHSLALLSNGTVMAWGDNSNGQLGAGTTTGLETCWQGGFNYPSCSSTPVPVSGLSEVSAISAGGLHSLALLNDGTVMAWGYDGSGQLGNGKEGGEEQSDVPVAVSGLSEVSAISAGGAHSLALLSNGTVKVWGPGAQLGIGQTAGADSDVPVAVSGLSGVTAITGGAEHSLALLSNGTVMAWGANVSGSLGVGDWTPRYFPVAVSGLSEVSAISAGGAHSLAVTPPGTPPTITSITPSSGPTAGGTSVTITGSGFLTGARVKIGNAATSVDVVSETEITATTAMTPAGSDEVVVSDFGGTSTGGPSYTYIAPPPTVTSITPTLGMTAGGTSVSITGTNFTGATGVKFGSTSATSFTVNSESSITAVSPVGMGTVDMTVTTPAGTSATSFADQFSYVPPPTVTKLKPTKGPVNGGTTVTLTGTNFTRATAVKFGSTNATSFTVKTVKSVTSITAVSPPETPATVDVTVTTPGGTSAISTKDHFKFVPTVTGLSPNTGSTAGGTSVTITGAGFAPGKTATVLKFGTTKGTSVNCTSTTECTVVSPAHAVGKVDVKATVNKLSSAKVAADQFTYS